MTEYNNFEERGNNEINNSELINKTNQTEANDDIRIATDIINITSETYESTISNCKKLYVNSIERENILNAVTDLLTFIPGHLIALAVVIDLSQEIPEFFSDVRLLINQVIKNINNFNQMLTIFINIHLLEKYDFIKNGELSKLLEINNLSNLNEKFFNFRIAEGIIKRTRGQKSFDFNVELEEFILDKNIYEAQYEKMLKNIEDFIILIPEKTTDFYLGNLIIYNFNFSHNVCCSFLTQYFNYLNYTDFIISIMMSFKEKEIDNTFAYKIFLKMTVYEDFLSTFYKLFPKMYKIECLEIKKHLSLLMFFLYEKYYRTTKKRYLNNNEKDIYDPERNEKEKECFKDNIDTEIFKKLAKMSDYEFMSNDYKEKFAHLVLKKTEIKPVNDFDLKKCIKDNNWEEIKECEDEKFLKAFVFISQPSISHFLTYMEILAFRFEMLDINGQNLFCEILEENYKNRDVFLKHVCDKIAIFDVVESDIRQKYPFLFIR